MTNSEKLLKLARQELPRLADNLIVPHEKGYRAFGRYDIVPRGSLFAVSENQLDLGEFGSTRTALSWCIADKYHQFSLAQQIKDLDQRSTWARECIETRSRISESAAQETKKVILTKLQHRRAVKYQIDLELEKCIQRAKYLQNRGFANDTQRTSPSGSTKTSR